MPALSYKRLATISIVATCALATGIAVSDRSDQSATAASANPPSSPAFSSLTDTGYNNLTPAIRDALSNAGAPKDAQTTASDRGDFTVVVVRGNQTYLALINNTSQRATIVESPPAELVNKAGSWVAAGGSGDGGRTVLAMLVPDEVNSVQVTTTDGTQSRTEVVDNIAVVQRENLSTAEYQSGGATHRVDLAPRARP